MTCTLTRFFGAMGLLALLGACEGMPGRAPADQPEFETMGDELNEPTDGIANELTVE